MIRNLHRWSALVAALGMTFVLGRGNSRSAAPKPSAVSQDRLRATYAQLPLHFEANQGQTDQQVKFLSRGDGYSLSLSGSEAVLTLRQGSGFRVQGPGKQQDARRKTQDAVLRMKLVGAKSQPRVTGAEELPGKVNYFLGNDPTQWRANVPFYAKVECEDVYPGVDVVYYGNQQQLEYDFIVAPGADPRTIALAFEGADTIKVDSNGNLILRTAAGEVVQRKPLIYQEVNGERRAIPGGYVLNPKSQIPNPHHSPLTTHQVGFHMGAYDTSRPLVIDPVLVYSTSIGGSHDEIGRDIAVDAAGNVYIAGPTTSVDFPTSNPLQPDFRGRVDAFVAKLNLAGNALIYLTYFGGSYNDPALSVAVDAVGNAYVTGMTDSPDFPTARPLQRRKDDDFDAFVVKLNPAGNVLVYSTYLGGNGGDVGNSIATDAAGNACVTGNTGSNNFPTANALQPFYNDNLDVFVAKLNPSGSALVYATYLGGNGRDEGNSIAVDAAGSVYVAGSTTSSDFPTTPNAFQRFYGDDSDAFVTKLHPNGSALVYSTFLGTGDHDYGWGIAVDAFSNACVTGYTFSSDFPTTANTVQPIYDGGTLEIVVGTDLEGNTITEEIPLPDAFVTKLNSEGSGLIYSTFLGGDGEDKGFAVAVDAAGNAYVTGETTSNDFPIANAFQRFYGDDGDAFVAKLNASGSAFSYCTYLGDGDLERAWGIATDAAGSAYVTGITKSSTFLRLNSAQPAFGGDSDAFVVKIADPPTDLTGVWAGVTQTSKGSGARLKSIIKGTLNVQNRGTQSAAPSALQFYLSSDVTLDGSDTFLKQVAIGGLRAGQTVKFKVTVTLRGRATGKFLLAVVDAAGAMIETDEANNVVALGPLN